MCCERDYLKSRENGHSQMSPLDLKRDTFQQSKPGDAVFNCWLTIAPDETLGLWYLALQGPTLIKRLLILSKSLHFSSRCLSGILSGSVSFYHELHEWTNGTNLFWFSIREIRLFVLFVIFTSPTPHGHNLSMRCLHSRITKEPKLFSNVP